MVAGEVAIEQVRAYQSVHPEQFAKDARLTCTLLDQTGMTFVDYMSGDEVDLYDFAYAWIGVSEHCPQNLEGS